MIDKMSSQEYCCLSVVVVVAVPPKATGPMSEMILDLQVAQTEQVRLQAQVTNLTDKLEESQAEVGHLKDQLITLQQDHNA